MNSEDVQGYLRDTRAFIERHDLAQAAGNADHEFLRVRVDTSGVMVGDEMVDPLVERFDELEAALAEEERELEAELD